MRSSSAILILTAALAVVPIQASGLKFTSSFESIKVQARPGDVVTRSWQLHLKDNQGARFHAKIEDWWQSEDGERSTYEKPGVLHHSCGPWITLSPVETVVAAGSTLSVQITATVPQTIAPGGYWCVLTVDQLPDPLAPAQGVQVNFLSSISTGIFIYIDPVVRELEITAIDISARQARIMVRNVGNAPVGLDGRIEISKTAEGPPVVSATFVRTTVLTEPIATRSFVTKLPDLAALPAGRYLVRVILDLGLDHDLGAQRELVIPDDLKRTAKGL